MYIVTQLCVSIYIYTPRYNHIHISWNVHPYIQLYAYIHIYVFGMPRWVVSMHPLTYTYICTYPYSIIAGMYLRSIYIYIYMLYTHIYTYNIAKTCSIIIPKHQSPIPYIYIYIYIYTYSIHIIHIYIHMHICYCETPMFGAVNSDT